MSEGFYPRNIVKYWLYLGIILVLAMVVIGGLTRLTHSGLSISNYKLISGTIPPMNEVEWNEAENYIYADKNPYKGPDAVLQRQVNHVRSPPLSVAPATDSSSV